MEPLLNNPVFNALSSGDVGLSNGNERAKFFDEEVSPFAGFEENFTKGFDELYQLLPLNRKILYASPLLIKEPKGWRLLNEIKGLQFVLASEGNRERAFLNPVPLQEKNIKEMVQLAALTKPGPFSKRTIEFGHYYGIFDNNHLVAMTGQRLHVPPYSEISAVCTHPDYTGRGFAAALVQHQVNLICDQGQTPFLHVREDNIRAIALYERLGFKVSRPMIFYFLARR